MKDEFTEYLKTLGMTKPLLDRAESAFSFYAEVIADPIEDLFVSEYIDQDGSRKFESLWFFLPDAVLEAKSFASQDQYDYSPLQKELGYWEVKRKDFDLKCGTEKSRLFLKVIFSGAGVSSITGDFKASGTNCDKLWGIFKRYIAGKPK